MPKAPILYRESFYEMLRDGTQRDLDWNLVNTSLGAMVEPRTLNLYSIGGPTVQFDPYDASINKRSQMSGDQAYTLLGTGGQQIPRTFNTL